MNSSAPAASLRRLINTSGKHGFCFVPGFWGAGIGSEVTSALIAAAFSSLGALRVVGIVDPTNHASLSMIKRLGFAFVEKYKGTTPWQQGHHVYSVEPHTHNPAVHRTLRDKAAQRR